MRHAPTERIASHRSKVSARRSTTPPGSRPSRPRKPTRFLTNCASGPPCRYSGRAPRATARPRCRSGYRACPRSVPLPCGRDRAVRAARRSVGDVRHGAQHPLHGSGWLLVALAAPVVTWAAYPFYGVAITNLRHGAVSMETLISTGSPPRRRGRCTRSSSAPPSASGGVWQAIMGSDAIYLELPPVSPCWGCGPVYSRRKATVRGPGRCGHWPRSAPKTSRRSPTAPNS